MKTVLAPIDFSPVTDRVVTKAIDLARAMDARLVLLHVIGPYSLLGRQLARSTVTGAELTAEAEKRAARRLGTLQRKLRDEGVTAHAVHVSGDPAECILEQAERLSANFIVLGSHGRTALRTLLVGSTAAGVLRGAQCSVVIVPPVEVVAAGIEERKAARELAEA
jgi:nucleotide-binding universal stress UspA family protein